MADGRSPQDADPKACMAYLAGVWPNAHIELLEHQGGCSVTFLLARTIFKTPSEIVQLRPTRFAVDPTIAQAAQLVHGELAPSIRYIGNVEIESSQLQIIRMSILPGRSFSEVQPRSPSHDAAAKTKIRRLLCDLAKAHADSWHSANVHSAPSGRIGRSIRDRITLLSKKLPSARLRKLARSTLLRIDAQELAMLPIVLTHGDMISSNILVQSDSWRLQGLVDWAEAEYLPFGMSLYSTEYVLGYLENDQNAEPSYVRYEQAQPLWLIFWQQLLELIPPLKEPVMLRAVHLARDLGVLLRHGFAWDDGRIDRVINPTDDAAELTYLEAFLSKNDTSRPEPVVESCADKHINTPPILV